MANNTGRAAASSNAPKTSPKKSPKKASKGGAKSKLNMRLTLILFALIPLLVSSLVIGIVLYNKSSKEMKTYTHNSLIQVVDDVGNSFDTMVETNKSILKAYSTAPILMQALKEPNNAEVQEKAQQFTIDYFSRLKG